MRSSTQADFLADTKIFNNNNCQGKLFPTVKLPLNKLHDVINEFKKTLITKRLQLYEVFKLLDKDSDSFVTINEFDEGMDKFLTLSKQAKYGLFAYFDNLKVGMFDLQRFVHVMSRITIEREN